MPQIENSNPNQSRKVAVLVGLAALVVLVAIGAVMFRLAAPPKAPPPKTASVLSEAQNLTFLAKYDQAVTILTNQLPYAQNNAERSQLWLAIGVANENKGDQNSALAAYLKADGYNSSFGINEAVGRTAAAAGNKALAITYYKRDIDMINNRTAARNAGDLPLLQQQVQQLGGTP